MTSRDNDDSTVEILLNQRLRELSNDIPDRDGMRARALQRLLLDYAEQGKPENAKPSRFAGRPVMIVVLALVATVGIVALLPSAQTTLVETSVGSSSTSTTPVVQASDPTSSTTEARPVETTSSSDLGTLTVEPDSSAVGMFDQGFNLGALELSFAATSTQMEQTGWILESELTDQVMFRIPTDRYQGLLAPTLRFAAPGSDLSATALAEMIVTRALDTDLVASETSLVANYSSQFLSLKSRHGTSRIAFDLGPTVNIIASGVQREFRVHLVDTENGVLVVWWDAPEEEIDRHTAAVGDLLETLQIAVKEQ